MPDRFDLDQFRMKKDQPPPVGRRSNRDGQMEHLLVASRRDAETKPLRITPEQWESALAASEAGGYTAPADNGLTRTQIRWFIDALHRASHRKRIKADDQEAIDGIISFCEKDGQFGFTTEKRYQRANRRPN